MVDKNIAVDDGRDASVILLCECRSDGRKYQQLSKGQCVPRHCHRTIRGGSLITLATSARVTMPIIQFCHLGHRPLTLSAAGSN